MWAKLAVGVLFLGAASTFAQSPDPGPAGCRARRNLFSRLGRAIERVAAVEPELSERLSSWGIREEAAEAEAPDPGARERVCRAALKKPKNEAVQLSARRPIFSPVSR